MNDHLHRGIVAYDVGEERADGLVVDLLGIAEASKQKNAIRFIIVREGTDSVVFAPKLNGEL